MAILVILLFIFISVWIISKLIDFYVWLSMAVTPATPATPVTPARLLVVLVVTPPTPVSSSDKDFDVYESGDELHEE